MRPLPDGQFELLSRRLGESYRALETARLQTVETMRRLAAHVSELQPPDTSFVFFGSIARGEWTQGSDVDWTLLVDGQADPAHRSVAREFTRRLAAEKFGEPGPTGVFGSVSFSHELIDCIGGERDTNMNTTRRALLLLESVSRNPVDVRERVVRGLLDRYLDSERSFFGENGRRYKVPRFLLNDIVRYWRTLCVDYVNKQWERGGDGWALRNVKLRFSRKLMFAAGLLTCFACRLDEADAPADSLFKSEDEAKRAVKESIQGRLGSTPLDVLCERLTTNGNDAIARKVLSAYDGFLAALANSDVRAKLKNLRSEAAGQDSHFNALRDLSHEFQEGLTMLFFDDPKLGELTRRYGVF